MSKSIVARVTGLVIGIVASGAASAQDLSLLGQNTAPYTTDTTTVPVMSFIDAQQDNIDVPITASILITGIVTQTGPINSAPVIVTGSSIEAAATANLLTPSSLTVIPGEDSVALAQNAVNNSAVSATIDTSNIGLITAGGVNAVTGNSPITVTSNLFNASATGNSGDLTLTANGANSGAGNAPSILFSTGPGTGGIDLTGDLLLGVNQLNVQSDLNPGQSGSTTATIGNTVTNDIQVIGVNLANSGDQISTSGGIAVNSNSSTASATGNSVTTQLDNHLAGTDVNAVLGVHQLQQDSSATATSTGVGIGVTGDTGSNFLINTTVAVEGNAIRSAATGNQATNTANTELHDAGATALVGTLQELNVTNLDVNVTATTDNARVGVVLPLNLAFAIVGSTLAASGNAVTSAAKGNSLSQSLNPDAGNVNGVGSITGEQTVLPGPANSISITATTGDPTQVLPPVVIGMGQFDTGSIGAGVSVAVADNTAASSAIGNIAQQGLGEMVGSVNAPISSTLTQRASVQQPASGASSSAIAANATTASTIIGVFAVGTVIESDVTVSGNSVSAVGGGNASTTSTGTITGSIAAPVTAAVTQDTGVAQSATALGDQSGTGSASISGSVTDVAVGVVTTVGFLAGDLSATPVNVSDNAIVASASGNSATDRHGAVTGVLSVSDTSIITQGTATSPTGVGQTATGSGAQSGTGTATIGATAGNINLGVNADDSNSIVIFSPVSLANNSVEASVAANSGGIDRAAIAGDVNGMVSSALGQVAGITQSAAGAGSSQSGSATAAFTAAVNTVNAGVTTTGDLIFSPLAVAGTTAASSATGNAASTSTGPISGSISGTVSSAVTQSVALTQSASSGGVQQDGQFTPGGSVAVESSTSNVIVGVSADDVFGFDTGLVTVTETTASALTNGNSADVSVGEVSGVVSGLLAASASQSSSLVQSATGGNSAQSGTGEASFTSTADTIALGVVAAGLVTDTPVTVSENTVQASTNGSAANIVFDILNGGVNAGAVVSSTIDQTSQVLQAGTAGGAQSGDGTLDVTSTATVVNAGVNAANFLISGSPIDVAGTGVFAATNGTSAITSFDAISGAVNGTVGSLITQLGTGVVQDAVNGTQTGQGTANFSSGIDTVNLGVMGTIDLADSPVTVSAGSNPFAVQATTNGNQASASFDTIAGGVGSLGTTASNIIQSAGVIQSGTQAGAGSANFSADVNQVNAGVSGVIASITGAPVTVAGTAGEVTIGAATAGNSASVNRGDISGSISGDITSDVTQAAEVNQSGTQTGSGAASFVADVVDVNAGILGNTLSTTTVVGGTEVTVSDFTVQAFTSGNTASTTLGAVNGVLNAGALVSSDIDQTAAVTQAPGQLGTGTMRVGSTVLGVVAGVNELASINDSAVTVNSNTAQAVTAINQATQDSTGVSGAGIIGFGAVMSITNTQTTTGVVGPTTDDTGSFIDAITFGIQGVLTDIAQNTTVPLTVADNTAGAQADGNNASQSLDAVTGGLVGLLTTTTTQSVTATPATGHPANQPTSVVALVGDLAPIVFGVDGNTQVVGGATSHLDLVVDSNSADATGRLNVANRSTGGLGGSITGLDVVTDTQTVDGSNVTATVTNVHAGLNDQGGAIAATSDNILFAVTDNNLDATGRGNLAVNNLGPITGAMSGTGSLTQTTTQYGDTEPGAPTPSLSISVAANVTDSDLGVVAGTVNLNLGGGTGNTNLNVSGNGASADAAMNLSSTSLGVITGSMTGTSSVSAATDQSTTQTTVSATVNTLNFGAQDNSLTVVGANGPVFVTVDDNSARAVASGNTSFSSLAGISGLLDTGTTVSLTDTQHNIIALDSGNTVSINASATDVDFGLHGIDDIASGAGTVATAVSNNQLVSAGNGNVDQFDVGTVSGTVSSLALTSTQINDAGVSITTNASNSVIGTAFNGDFGTGAAASLAVANNSVLASNAGNTHRSTIGDIAGNLNGPGLSTLSTQTNTLDVADSRLAAVSGIDIGLIDDNAAGTIGGRNAAALAVADNSVAANVVGNRSTTEVSSLVTFAAGSVTLTGVQTNTGSDTADQMNASLDGTRVGLVVNGVGTTIDNASAVVSGNTLSAAVSGNFADRNIQSASGILNGASMIAMLDTQLNTDLRVTAEVGTTAAVEIGAILNNTGAVNEPLNVVVNNNVVQAAVNGNVASQALRADGLFSASSALPSTSLMVSQTNNGGQLLATVANTRIGLDGTAGPSFTGSSIVRGNTISAIATGNTATMIRH
jgi:hypothetical protein